MSYTDKVVLITGAASGIGRGAALAYAEKGAKVVVADLDREGADTTVSAIREAGGEAFAILANVAKYDEVRQLIQSTVEQYGRLDIAINNAGIGGPMNRTAATDLADWDRVIAVNQSGVFYCMKEELSLMEQQGSGCIVNVSSIAGLRSIPGQIAYAASKHAVVGMTKTAAVEYARLGIRINSICPVFTHTPLVDKLFASQEGIDKKLLRTIPMRRFGEVDDIVNAILWLTDPGSSFVTGLNLPIDGGQSA